VSPESKIIFHPKFEEALKKPELVKALGGEALAKSAYAPWFRYLEAKRHYFRLRAKLFGKSPPELPLERAEQDEDYQSAMRQFSALTSVSSPYIAERSQYMIAMLFGIAMRHEKCISAINNYLATYDWSDEAPNMVRIREQEAWLIKQSAGKGGRIQTENEQPAQPSGQPHAPKGASGFFSERKAVVFLISLLIMGLAVCALLLLRSRKKVKPS